MEIRRIEDGEFLMRLTEKEMVYLSAAMWSRMRSDDGVAGALFCARLWAHLDDAMEQELTHAIDEDE